jgi:hypothetical protein
MTDRPSIDHSLLSPSGRMSKRARKQALAREAERLFPPGTFDTTRKQPSEAEALRAHAARLEDLAARGMSTPRYRKQAAQARAQADELDRQETS